MAVLNYFEIMLLLFSVYYIWKLEIDIEKFLSFDIHVIPYMYGINNNSVTTTTVTCDLTTTTVTCDLTTTTVTCDLTTTTNVE